MRIAMASPQSMVLAVHAAFFVSKPAATGLNAFFKIDFNFLLKILCQIGRLDRKSLIAYKDKGNKIDQ